MAAEKKLEKYLVEAEAHATSLDAYAANPAGTFLIYVCDAYDAFHHCENKFTKKKDGHFNKDSESSLRHISCAVLSALMGHFETYQKSLLSGLIDRSAHFPDFDSGAFVKHFGKHCGGDINIEVGRLLALRGAKTQIGYVISDALHGWHDPSRVNAFFKGLGVKKDAFTSTQVSDLRVLWQLRHSIVHTGAWLSLPDSQKVSRLHGRGNKPIIFEHAFVNAVCRKLHKIVKHVNGVLLAESQVLLGANADQGVITDLENFLNVTSPKNVWL
ncbi:hypothetical protein C7293_14790 [filamentous cyanobacterium CCT1]|nr:hypothetical protein C7293_14790 [filamentous cyanobacterium CCT1]PSN80362.1 hypothetical protein C8B47_06935 [filamentous cyanobacterium CCP4]